MLAARQLALEIYHSGEDEHAKDTVYSIKFTFATLVSTSAAVECIYTLSKCISGDCFVYVYTVRGLRNSTVFDTRRLTVVQFQIVYKRACRLCC